MKAALVTVVFQKDLALFYLHALSLDQNWLGPRNWHIVVEDWDTTVLYVKEIVGKLSNTWTITIDRPDLGPDHFKPGYDGWWRQQTLKFWAATYFDDDLFIILDAKNILLKPADLSYFYHYGSCAVTLREPDTEPDNSMEMFWNTCKEKLELSKYNIPRCSDLTPWIWPKYIVQSTLDRVHELGLDTEARWQNRHKLLEFQLVWAHTWDRYEWHSWGEMVYFQTGPEEYQTDQDFRAGLEEGLKRFREHEKIIFWTQHRRDMHRSIMVEILLDQITAWGLSYDRVAFDRYFSLGQAQQK